MRKKQKGEGGRINNAITLDQRYKLFKWCEGNKQGTYEQLSEKATDDLGFLITKSVMASHHHCVHGGRVDRTSKKKIHKATKQQMLEMIIELQSELSKMKGN